MSIEEERRQDNDEPEEVEGLETSEPYSIVWTALPVISWVVPFIGHTGITE